jgi:2-(1,2-epoxy-1,2-dihydrophenyl)acetyl-CoA isomerase
LVADDPRLRVERSAGGIVTVTFDRPEKRNALTPVMWRDLGAALQQIRDSKDDRCVIVTGAGGDFSTGVDLFAAWPDEEPLRRMQWLPDVVLTLHRLPQPTIARVRGVAAGALCWALSSPRRRRNILGS